jgi:hypothetical protein
MIRSTLLLSVVLSSSALVIGACGSDDGGDDKGETGGTGSSTYYGGYGGSDGGSGGSTYYGGSGGSDGGSAGSSQGGAAGGSQGGAAGGGGLSPIDGSCQNHCGDSTPPPGAKCYCDDSCIPIGDCCSDYDQYCEGSGGSGGNPSGGGGSGGSSGGLTSCVGHCGDTGAVPGSSPACYCDDLCTGSGDCCFDFNVACAFSGNGGSGGGSGTPTCTGHCGKITPVPGSNPPCYCDVTCSLANDCCADYDTKC